MKKKIIFCVSVGLIIILFLFLALSNWDTGNNYMEELRQVSTRTGVSSAFHI